MKHTIKLLLLMLLAVTVFVLAGCSGEKDQYTLNDEAGYKVSVQYHANGGEFTAGTYTITDSYKVDGKSEIHLLDPADSARSNPFKAYRTGYFLAGWYTERTETGKNEKDEPIYSYSGYWDFANDTLPIQQDKSYSASQPVLHLYAAWVPNFTFEFYELATGDMVDTVTIDPTDAKQLELELSYWDEGSLKKKDIPAKKGYTYNGLYLDAEGTQQVTDKTVSHNGVLDLETATVTGSVMKLYVDYMEGEFEAVSTPEAFIDCLSYDGDMIITADLDFTDVQWPMEVWSDEYSGKIQGNGHTLSNITVKIAPERVNKREYLYAGIVGMLGEDASVQDLTVKKLKLELAEGGLDIGMATYQNHIAVGLLAGQLAEGAVTENVTIEGCEILLPLVIENYTYTLTVGNVTDITVKLTGENAENYTTEITDGVVNIVELPEEDPEAETEEPEA